MDFRTIIRDELTRQGMTQARLAERAKMTEAKVSDYLAGKRGANADTLARMFDVLGIKVQAGKSRRKAR